MNLIDSHCHINDKQFSTDLDSTINRAIDKGITHLVCIGTDIKSSEKAIQISQKYTEVFATCGIHPHEADKADKNFINILEELAKHEKVVAIGEMGLDYYYDFSEKKNQNNVFQAQLELSKDLNLPAVIHNRDSDKDLLNILTKSNTSYGVIHCFASDYKMAKKLLDLGLYISFTGMVTFVRSLKEVIKKVDLHKIMIETDSPYLAPHPFRGKRNEPKNVIEVAKFIANIKNIDLNIFNKVVYENTKNFFKLPN